MYINNSKNPQEINLCQPKIQKEQNIDGLPNQKQKNINHSYFDVNLQINLDLKCPLLAQYEHIKINDSSHKINTLYEIYQKNNPQLGADDRNIIINELAMPQTWYGYIRKATRSTVYGRMIEYLKSNDNVDIKTLTYKDLGFKGLIEPNSKYLKEFKQAILYTDSGKLGENYRNSPQMNEVVLGLHDKHKHFNSKNIVNIYMNDGKVQKLASYAKKYHQPLRRSDFRPQQRVITQILIPKEAHDTSLTVDIKKQKPSIPINKINIKQKILQVLQDGLNLKVLEGGQNKNEIETKKAIFQEILRLMLQFKALRYDPVDINKDKDNANYYNTDRYINYHSKEINRAIDEKYKEKLNKHTDDFNEKLRMNIEQYNLEDKFLKDQYHIDYKDAIILQNQLLSAYVDAKATMLKDHEERIKRLKLDFVVAYNNILNEHKVNIKLSNNKNLLNIKNQQDNICSGEALQELYMENALRLLKEQCDLLKAHGQTIIAGNDNFDVLLFFMRNRSRVAKKVLPQNLAMLLSPKNKYYHNLYLQKSLLNSSVDILHQIRIPTHIRTLLEQYGHCIKDQDIIPQDKQVQKLNVTDSAAMQNLTDMLQNTHAILNAEENPIVQRLDNINNPIIPTKSVSLIQEFNSKHNSKQFSVNDEE